MRPIARHVLYVRHTVGKGHVTYPVSVHANRGTATEFRRKLETAHAAGDLPAVQALSPHIKLTDDGRLYDNIAFTVKELPYEPAKSSAQAAEDDFDV